MRRRFLRALSGGLVAVALLTACGSDSDSDTTTSSGSGAGSTPATQAAKPTGKPIVIGTICSCSGPFASSVGSHSAVVEAWEKSINDAGGINGRPVEVRLEDDGGDAAKSQRLVRKLVEQDKIVALVAEQTPSFDSTWADYITKKGVPVIGGTPFTPPMMANANFFPSGGNYPAQVWGLATATKQAGGSKVAVLACSETPFCANYAKQLTEVSKAAVPGVEVVYQTKIAASTTNFTSQCLAAKEAGADTMYVGHSGSVIQEVVAQCTKLGYTPIQISAGGGVISEWSNDPNMAGIHALQFNVPVHDETTPGAKEFHAAIEKYAPDLPEASNYADNSMVSWAGLQLFAAAAKAAELGPDATSDDLRKGLYALKDETLGGLAPPLSFVEGEPTVIDCYFNQSIEDGKWTTPGGTDPVCIPEDVAPKVHEALAKANS